MKIILEFCPCPIFHAANQLASCPVDDSSLRTLKSATPVTEVHVAGLWTVLTFQLIFCLWYGTQSDVAKPQV